jgi:hypothetical protein
MWRMVAAVNMKELVKSFDLYPYVQLDHLQDLETTLLQVHCDTMLQGQATTSKCTTVKSSIPC